MEDAKGRVMRRAEDASHAIHAADMDRVGMGPRQYVVMVNGEGFGQRLATDRASASLPGEECVDLEPR
jgi:hypothetical protein